MIDRKDINCFVELNEKIKDALTLYVREKHPNSLGNDFYFESFEIDGENVNVNYEWFGTYNDHSKETQVISVQELIDLVNKNK